MIRGGAALYSGIDYGFYYLKAYISGQYKHIVPYRYTNGQWVPIGGAGCLMVPFYDSNGQKVYDTNGDAYLVRHDNRAGKRLKDSNDLFLTDSNGNYLLTGGL